MAALEALPRSKATPSVIASGRKRSGTRSAPPLDLPDVRIHDLRHTFASPGAAGGLPLPLIAAILGHRDVKTTLQYAHLADSPVKAAADRTAAAIEGAMSGRDAGLSRLRGSRFNQ